jgi:hypothetical protein
MQCSDNRIPHRITRWIEFEARARKPAAIAAISYISQL